MKKLAVTLCLTIAVLLKGAAASGSSDLGEWRSKGNIISPECFPYELPSNDNFEAIAEHHGFKYTEEFSDNPGKYFGREIKNFDGVPEPWTGGKYKLYAIRDLKTCPDRKQQLHYKDGFVIFRLNEGGHQIKYRKGKDIPLKICNELAPNLNANCIRSSIFLIGWWEGGSRGFYWNTYIYGLFQTEDDKEYIVPLKGWYGRSEDEALKFYEKIGAARLKN